jgi:hypothetical protein
MFSLGRSGWLKICRLRDSIGLSGIFKILPRSDAVLLFFTDNSHQFRFGRHLITVLNPDGIGECPVNCKLLILKNDSNGLHKAAAQLVCNYMTTKI